MSKKPSAIRVRLIQSVMSDQINLTSADDAAAFMHEIAEITFDGHFAGGGAYFNFKVGSWLAEKLSEHVRRAEAVSRSSFVHVLINVGTDKALEEWKNVVDSYLILPGVPCYKANVLPELPLSAPEIWKVAYDHMHREWWPKAHNGQLKEA
jgi:hypothetical protein